MLTRLHEPDLVLLRAAVAHTGPGGTSTKAQVQILHEAEDTLEGIEEELKVLALHEEMAWMLRSLTEGTWAE